MFWPGTSILLTFIAASLAMNVVPGLDMTFVIGQSLSAGWRVGRWAALGIAGGSLCQVVMAAAGLSALLAARPGLLLAITYAGAGYMVYLAVGILRAPAPHVPSTAAEASGRGSRPACRAFRRGVLVNLLNPKVILFYLVFLPQFVRPGAGPYWQQVLFFGLTFNVLGTGVLLFAAAGGTWLTATLFTRPGAQVALRRLCSAVLVALAVALIWVH
jgi:threonine/homoserine/homoserine lactone efflux protein